ncbi:hypothetical protein Fot_38000 [Forsythia ovata]|uniref:Uncharacterized protein n=1 Tax=Forsythia ovata TaxID=205694 RepID=A0ABD1S2V9_9LAMI
MQLYVFLGFLECISSIRVRYLMVCILGSEITVGIRRSTYIDASSGIAYGVCSIGPCPVDTRSSNECFLHCSVDDESSIGFFSTVSLMPKVTLDISSALPLEEPQLSSENFRRSDKGKRVINDEGEKTMPKRGMENEDSV